VRQWTDPGSDFDFGPEEEVEPAFSWDPASLSGEEEGTEGPGGAAEAERRGPEFGFGSRQEPEDPFTSNTERVRAKAEGRGVGARGGRSEAEGVRAQREEPGKTGGRARGEGVEGPQPGRSGVGWGASGGVPLDGSGLECVAGAGAAVLLKGQPGEQFAAHHWRTLQR